MESFIERMRRFYPLSDGNAELLLECMEEIRCGRGEMVVSEGQRDSRVYFVKEGFTRAFVERDGKDITLWFAAEGEMAINKARKISSINVEALEETILYSISQERLEALFESSLEFANWGRRIQEYYLSEYEHYFIHYGWADAKEQYEELFRRNPGLFQRVPLKYIASYLQITPQSLSRIRGKVKD